MSTNKEMSQKNVKKTDEKNENYGVNDLTTSDIFKVTDLHFYRKNYIFRHLHDSYNKFLDEDVKNFLETEEHVISENMIYDPPRFYRYRFKFENIKIQEPMLDNGIEPLFPSVARHNNLTYTVKVFADVTQYQDIIDIASDEKVTRQNGNKENNVLVAIIPLMVRSKYCTLTTNKGIDKNECDYDPGGYFLVKGNEKVVICQDRMIENKPLVFVKKDSGLYIQVNSRSYKDRGIIQPVSIRMKKDGELLIKVPILNEVNVMVLLKALGMELDRNIINYITYDEYDNDMIDILRISLESCKNDKGVKITTQDDALDYLVSKMKIMSKKISQHGEKEIIHLQKRKFVINSLTNNLLPHVDESSVSRMMNKAYYICYMINKLVRGHLGRIPLDDRDSYLNKRVDLPGDLMYELYKQYHKKMLGDCKKYFDQRNKGPENPNVIIHILKPNIVEQGINAALSTGHWLRKQGVAQMMQRLTYLYSISLLRRIDSPGVGESTMKMTTPRHLHPSSAGFLCCVTGDTEILQGDNASVKQIKDMKNGDTVMSVYKEDLREMPTAIKNYFSRENDNIVEIKTLSGRKLKCTLDHPLLTRSDGENKMVDAGDLKVGDSVVIRNFEKYLELNKDCDFILKSPEIDNDYLAELKLLNFVDKPIPQEKLEIFARLIGYCITDGNITKISKEKEQYQVRFSLGEEEDVYEIIDDMQKLGFGSPYITRSTTHHTNYKNGIHTIHKTWTVSKGGAFGYFMMKMGGLVGDKTIMTRKIPDWILNGNNRIKREFLSGFNGGDGSRFSMQKNENRYKLSVQTVYQTTTNEFLKDTENYINSIINMYTEFNIQCILKTEKILEEDKTKVGFYISNTYENLAKFSELIGYRYCNEKRRASAPVIEYVKYKTDISNTKKDMYKKIIELSNNGTKLSQIVEDTGFEYQIVKRILENLRKGKIPEPREFETGKECIDYSTFLDKYYIGKMNLAMPIISITKIPSETVYDFTTVLDSHTLIANGFVTSNCIETPEHAKIGLTKHLSMIGSITIMSKEQYFLISDYLMKRITKISDIPPEKFREHNIYKVFLNGDWLGVTEDAFKLSEEMNKKRLEGHFNIQNTSIVRDDDECEVRVYCDSGRLYRPVLRVENNVVKLNRTHIGQISLNKNDKNKVSSWDEFMIKFPEVVDYIDTELQPYVMVAYKMKKIEEMRKRMVESVKKVKDIISSHVENRYDDMMYVKYNYCEFHPSLLIGEIITNAPFCNMNAGQRNIFQYAQGRQAMTIYATNYRSRLDISYILYKPQRSLVHTKSSVYTNTRILPPGENCLVAIGCYTG
jgi:DNA-directed RNA polymerase beta subunit/intein/homing endonuclease